jgi:methanogenic corrinoid protein MtbC1
MVSMSEHMHTQSGWGDKAGSNARPGPGSRTGRRLGADGRSLLEDTIKRDIIPRLVALPWVARDTATDLKPQIGQATVRKLVALCLDIDTQGVAVFVSELHRSGVEAVSIYEDLLTPAARQLGVMWENDVCTFADVTIGVLRLQNAQRALATRPLGDAAPALGTPRALLLPVPGEQHTFGLSIVLDYFLRAGWEARMGPAGSRAEALALISRERTELVGLSFACDEMIPVAKALIAAMRKASANPGLIIMVGGPPFMADPALAEALGADATATDGNQAVVRANELLHRPLADVSTNRPLADVSTERPHADVATNRPAARP